MKATINSEMLSESIRKELEDWSRNDVTKAVNEAAKESAKEAEEELKKGGPYTERTGKYTKDWTSGIRDKRQSVITNSVNYTVYNKKNYQLTHLLEKGHLARDGSRVKTYEHIGPVNKQVEENMVKKIEERLQK